MRASGKVALVEQIGVRYISGKFFDKFAVTTMSDAITFNIKTVAKKIAVFIKKMSTRPGSFYYVRHKSFRFFESLEKFKNKLLSTFTYMLYF